MLVDSAFDRKRIFRTRQILLTIMTMIKDYAPPGKENNAFTTNYTPQAVQDKRFTRKSRGKESISFIELAKWKFYD